MNAIPVEGGRELISFVQASKPPADAPIATIKKSGKVGRGCECSGLVRLPAIVCNLSNPVSAELKLLGKMLVPAPQYGISLSRGALLAQVNCADLWNHRRAPLFPLRKQAVLHQAG